MLTLFANAAILYAGPEKRELAAVTCIQFPTEGADTSWRTLRRHPKSSLSQPE